MRNHRAGLDVQGDEPGGCLAQCANIQAKLREHVKNQLVIQLHPPAPCK